MQVKTFRASFKADGDQGDVQAIVNAYNLVDLQGERVLHGCFADSIAKRLPKVAWMHRWDEPIGKTLEAKELPVGDPLLPADLTHLGGLWVHGQLNLETQRGREAFSDLKFGAIDEFSIGFEIETDRFTDGVRELVKGTLYEWSPVFLGANQATALISAKAFLSDAALFDDPQFPSLVKLYRDAAAALRRSAKEGRVISSANADRITQHVGTLRDASTQMGGCADDLEAMLAEATPPPKGDDPPPKGDDRADIEALFLRARHLAARRHIRQEASA